MLSTSQWHERYRQQAGWTQAMRRHLFQRIGLKKDMRVLEVGCGTGAITADLASAFPVAPFGLDHNPEYLVIARREDPTTHHLCAEALTLPFGERAFDATFCHMFLLWMPSPVQALFEMARVTRPGGWVLALAEPDYAGRIDYPLPLAQMGRLQSAALKRQGANPDVGRQLSSLFIQAGLTGVESGLLGGQFTVARAMDGFETEWQVLRADLAGEIPDPRLDELRRLDEVARRKGERILFVPTFYAIGQISG
jgi:SAM-dependent methyltransferase